MKYIHPQMRFGQIEVLHRSGSLWECRCDCGNLVTRTTGELNAGRRHKCGECARKAGGKRIGDFRRGQSSPYPKNLRKVFYSMRDRCHSSHTAFYSYYGANGIQVCEEWRNNPSAFCEWALANGYAPGLSIDRIDGSKGYSPDNCRWTTKQVQAENRSSVHWVTWQGITDTITGWSRRIGVKKGSLWFRFKKGWPLDQIFNTPFA